jgi:hypothetical protein
MGGLFIAGKKMSKLSLFKYSSIVFVCFFVIGWNVYFKLLEVATFGVAIRIVVVIHSAADSFVQEFLHRLSTSACVGLFGVSVVFSVYNTVTNIIIRKALFVFVGYLSIGLVVIAGNLILLRSEIKAIVYSPFLTGQIGFDIRNIPLYRSFLLACVVVLVISFVIRKIMLRGSRTATSNS